MIWYRGHDESTATVTGWHAAGREYAEFFGADVSEMDDTGLRVLDLTGMGVGGGWDDRTETYEPEVYQRVEKMAARLARRYDAVRLMQWHDGYCGPDSPQEALLVLRAAR